MHIDVRGNGGIEEVNKALKHLSKLLKKEGIMEEVYRRQEYVKPSKKRKLKKSEAIRRKKRDEHRERKFKNTF